MLLLPSWIIAAVFVPVLEKNLDGLQTVQNSASRLLTRPKKHDHLFLPVFSDFTLAASTF